MVSGEVRPPALAVGRAVRLALSVLGNALPGVTNLSTQGHPGRLSWCLAEAADSPWPALHREAAPTSASGVTAVASAGHLEVILGRATVEVDIGILAEACRAVRGAGLTGGRCAVRYWSSYRPRRPPGWPRPGSPGPSWPRSSGGAPEAAAANGPAGEVEVLSNGPVGRPADVLVAVCGGVGIKGTVVQTWGSGSAVTVGLVPADG